MGICLESEEEDTFAGYFFGVGLILIAEDQSIQGEDTGESQPVGIEWVLAWNNSPELIIPRRRNYSL